MYGGILTILEELKVERVIIGKQMEDSYNYQKFRKIVNEQKIKVSQVTKGNRLQVEKNLYFDILWPNDEKAIYENSLNNNSLVCKLYYKNFSMLFTGDIEEIAEKTILQDYKDDLEILNSTILKVAHHGSESSSSKNFIENVNPKVAVIEVGENNKFGHPNENIIESLENMRNKNIQDR